MQISDVNQDTVRYEFRSCRVLIVGTGAAGYAAAWNLYQGGESDIVMLSENVLTGTSRNAGSDKQTYYKLGMSGDSPDSVRDMARDLFAGGAMDGDLALAESAGSADAFLNLARLGVPFPTNRYGEYVGYRTDHDSRERATSAGPLTSKWMTEHLEKAVVSCGIPILDGYRAVELLKDRDGACIGLIAIAAHTAGEAARMLLISASNVILATGGPAGIYRDTVYPHGHIGGSGMALEAGVVGKNLTEWQYGLSSVTPRWNVSGTYMQVLPSMISVDDRGVEHEFLLEHFGTAGAALSALFRKGYEWPFDVRKLPSGSSAIDLLVWRETVLLGRRVYLDYRRNPFGEKAPDLSLVDEDCRTYLTRARADFGTPLDRLCHMNRPAYELYLDKGVDLAQERLEIALCAQHNNGGLAVDLWWQTNIPGLFAVGECAGTHGVYRPGGSALNAGQVGAKRAAQYILQKRREEPLSHEAFMALAEPAVRAQNDRIAAWLGAEDRTHALLAHTRRQMSRVGGAVRRFEDFDAVVRELEELVSQLDGMPLIDSAEGIGRAYALRDTLITQLVYLSAMRDYVALGGMSRGSALYVASEDEIEKIKAETSAVSSMVLETVYEDGSCRSALRQARELPEGGGMFETVWREYRQHKNVY